jgi:uncharacterized protein (UPF0332 family)
VTGRFDPDLMRAATQAQELREAADYDARLISPAEAVAAVDAARAFLEAVERMLAA